ncbi:MAG: hypothetical protein AB7J13_12830 [Pyrinomonadaceae bacterium]
MSNHKRLHVKTLIESCIGTLPKRSPFVRILPIFCLAVFAVPGFSGEIGEDRLAPRFPYSRHKQMVHAAMEKALAEKGIRLDDRTAKNWKRKLSRASLYQDFIKFFHSKAHFDNCNFRGGIEHINGHRRGIDRQYARLLNESSPKARAKIRENIMFRVGRISHTIQDFFSHSNFTEIQSKSYSQIDLVPTPDFWNEIGQSEILGMVSDGLVSAPYFWSFPRRCVGKTQVLVHKDHPNDRAGRVPTAWDDGTGSGTLTVYEASFSFAERSTQVLFREVFRNYEQMTKDPSVSVR